MPKNEQPPCYTFARREKIKKTPLSKTIFEVSFTETILVAMLKVRQTLV
jgi:hypothetical protein